MPCPPSRVWNSQKLAELLDALADGTCGEVRQHPMHRFQHVFQRLDELFVFRRKLSDIEGHGNLACCNARTQSLQLKLPRKRLVKGELRAGHHGGVFA